ncbi:hypothetical protein [Myroides sp. ZB35]|uniref:hypothetical protein n=1 Tax=Myroides sp. ZB35 TaxID=1458492 RepID=UPI0012EBC177|nr:hypothetical protein [Myroides sp. ZB35]
MNKIVLSLLKVVLTLVGSTFFLMSCKKDKSNVVEEAVLWDSIKKTEAALYKEQMQLDSLDISKLLSSNYPTYSAFMDGMEVQIPFLYDYEEVKLGNNVSFWDIGDISIKDREHPYYRFSSNLTDETAMSPIISMVFFEYKDGDYLKMNDVLAYYRKFVDIIYYYDTDSLIYVLDGNVYCFYFRYLEKEKKYVLFHGKDGFIYSNESYKKKLEYVINYLRIPKTLFKKKNQEEFSVWSDYTTILSPTLLKIAEEQRKKGCR